MDEVGEDMVRVEEKEEKDSDEVEGENFEACGFMAITPLCRRLEVAKGVSTPDKSSAYSTWTADTCECHHL